MDTEEKSQCGRTYSNVIHEGLEKGVEDEFGVIYSEDGKKLLACRNKTLDAYSVKKGTQQIGDSAFIECKLLTYIEIPDSVGSIGKHAFVGCVHLNSIRVAPDNKKYDSRENCNALIETQTNTLITGCRNTVIPETVTHIGEDAFSHCEDLSSIEIPDSVKVIGESAFVGCKNLSRIRIPDSVTFIGDRAFELCSCLTHLEIPDSVTTIGESAFSRCRGLTYGHL